MRAGNRDVPQHKPMELKKIEGLLCRSPDIREDMVADLRTRIFGKMYEVKAERVAEKIVQHGIYAHSMLEGNTSHPP